MDDCIDKGWRRRRGRDQAGGVAVGGLVRSIFAGLLRRGLRRGQLVETGGCGLGHDLLREGGFPKLFPRVGSWNDRVSGTRRRQVVRRTGAGAGSGSGSSRGMRCGCGGFFFVTWRRGVGGRWKGDGPGWLEKVKLAPTAAMVGAGLMRLYVVRGLESRRCGENGTAVPAQRWRLAAKPKPQDPAI